MSTVIKDIMFDGVLEKSLCVTDKNGETVCHTVDKRFIKFPFGEDLNEAIELHNQHNSTIPESPQSNEDELALKEFFGETEEVEQPATEQ